MNLHELFVFVDVADVVAVVGVSNKRMNWNYYQYDMCEDEDSEVVDIQD